jgi:hypothetical protein
MSFVAPGSFAFDFQLPNYQVTQLSILLGSFSPFQFGAQHVKERPFWQLE